MFPYEKVKEKFIQSRKEYWSRNLDKLREKSLSEIIYYIEKDMMGESSYHVYNAPCHDSISYSNAFYLQHFVGYGGSRYRKKDNPLSKLYKELYSKKEKDTFNDSSFYEDLYQTLFKKIKSKYQDVQITEGTDRYYRKYPYFQLKIER